MYHSPPLDSVIEPLALKIWKLCMEVCNDHVFAILRLSPLISEYIIKEVDRHELMHASDNSLPALISTHSPICIYCVV
mgnify:CR=1 FL=1